MMTKKQLTMIHVIMHKAWDAACYQEGRNDFADAKAAEEWRRDELETVVGQRSTKGLSQTQFEEAMVHFAIIAQDAAIITHFSAAAQRRYRWQLHRFLRLLSDVRGEASGWSYVRSIMDRMVLPEDIMDMTQIQMQNVLIALDTHLRRTLSALGYEHFTDVRRMLESTKPGARQHMLDCLAHARKKAGREPPKSPTPEVAHVLRDLAHGHVEKI